MGVIFIIWSLFATSSGDSLFSELLLAEMLLLAETDEDMPAYPTFGIGV